MSDNPNDNIFPSKNCTQCGKSFPATGEFWYSRGNRFNATCKQCEKDRTSKWRSDHPEYQKEYNARRDPEKNRERCAQRSASHREEARQTTARWRSEHRDQSRLSSARWYTEHREEVNQKRKRRRLSDPDKLREQRQKSYLKNKEKASERARKWRKSNPDKIRAAHHRRMARKRSLPDTITAQDIQSAYSYFHNCCAVCGHQLNGFFTEPNLDHWVPLALPNCPGSTPSNMLPLCSECNSKKKDADPIDWLVRRFGAKKASVIEKRIALYFESVRKEA